MLKTIHNKPKINQSYILNCKCNISPGIIIKEGKLVCRWCNTELTKGGSVVSIDTEKKEK